MSPRERASEEGYVLIAAIWLLVLAGAIAALLMLDGVTATRQARAEADILKQRLALEAAVETIIADRIMNGGRSIWSQSPASGSINIDGISISVRSTSEAGRVDLFRADARLLDATLRSAGVSAEQRQIIIGRVSMETVAKRHPSLALVETIVASSTAPSGSTCLADLFTPFHGGRMTQTVGTTTAAPGAAAAAEPLHAGAIQRLELRTQQGAALTVLLRVTAQRGKAAQILDWRNASVCVT